MSKTPILFLLIMLLLAACNPIANNGRNLPPTIENQPDGTSAQDSPRMETPPTATILPPTWTPLPSEPGAHLPGVSNSNSIAITETREVVTYTVQRGDTLAEICNEYGASIDEVARINNISDWDVIEVGQVLTIPVSGN